MNVNQLRQSRYLTRADVGKGVLLTIRQVIQEDVSMESEPERLRWVMYFNEAEKGVVLNSTNGQIIAQFLGSDETEAWTGQKVVLFDDPTIAFGGKVVGGIRARAPRNQPAAPPAAARPVFKPQPQQTNLPAEFQTGPETGDSDQPF